MTDQKKIQQYCSKLSDEPSALLNELERETNLKTLAPQMLSGKLQGRLLSTLSKMIRPSSILEIGTFTGYGTLCLAEGLVSNGSITTIEVNKELTIISSKFFNLSKYKDQINAIEGDALKIIPTLSNEIDLVFIDAGKKNNWDYLELVVPKLKKGGHLFIDNVLWDGKVINEHRDPKAQKIHDFNEKVLQDPRLEGIILPIRDGLSIYQKL